MLTRKQHQLLVFINQRLEETGVSPSFDEMKEALDLRSKSGIHRLITALEERGFIRRLAHKARAIEIVKLPEALAPKGLEPRVIEGDALKLDHAELMGGEPFAVLSNLPYNVGTALFVRWLAGAKGSENAWPPLWTSLTLMFQQEVAQRIVAQPGGSAYGRLAVLAQWRSRAKLAMKVHRSAFTPPPKVDSAVVRLDPGEFIRHSVERLVPGNRDEGLGAAPRSVAGASVFEPTLAHHGPNDAAVVMDHSGHGLD